MNKSLILGGVVLVVVVGIVFAVSHRDADVKNDIDMDGVSDTVDNGNATPTSTVDATPTSTVSSTQSNGGVTTPTSTIANSVKIFNVTASNFKFSTAEIKVKKGDTVRIVLTNSGGFHDFKIDEFNVATKRITGGGTDTVEFVADKTGTFEFYCSVGEHRQMGMRGNLIVE